MGLYVGLGLFEKVRFQVEGYKQREVFDISFVYALVFIRTNRRGCKRINLFLMGMGRVFKPEWIP